MFIELQDTFEKVYKMAVEKNEEERREYPKSESGIVTLGNIPDKKVGPKEQELYDYLNSLDFEIVKIIQTITYLGRDSDYDDNDSYEERYISYRKHHDLSGWNEKEIEVMQMVQKKVFATYLEQGFKILGINI